MSCGRKGGRGLRWRAGPGKQREGREKTCATQVPKDSNLLLDAKEDGTLLTLNSQTQDSTNEVNTKSTSKAHRTATQNALDTPSWQIHGHTHPQFQESTGMVLLRKLGSVLGKSLMQQDQSKRRAALTHCTTNGGRDRHVKSHPDLNGTPHIQSQSQQKFHLQYIATHHAGNQPYLWQQHTPM